MMGASQHAHHAASIRAMVSWTRDHYLDDEHRILQHVCDNAENGRLSDWDLIWTVNENSLLSWP